MLQLIAILASIGVLVALYYTQRENRLHYASLDRRQEFSELRLLAIERALLEQGIVVPPVPED